MKLKSFRIQNYKSIIDTSCRLSDTDNITVLAGQNESGKSSLLQALYDFEKNEIRNDALRDDQLYPVISCIYSTDKEDQLFESIQQQFDIRNEFREAFDGVKEIKVEKRFKAVDDFDLIVSGDFIDSVKNIIKILNNKAFEGERAVKEAEDAKIKALEAQKALEAAEANKSTLIEALAKAESNLKSASENEKDKLTDEVNKIRTELKEAIEVYKTAKISEARLSKASKQAEDSWLFKIIIEIRPLITQAEEDLNKALEEEKNASISLQKATSALSAETVEANKVAKQEAVKKANQEHIKASEQLKTARHRLNTIRERESRENVVISIISEEEEKTLIQDVEDAMLALTPAILLFDDFCDLLPATILVSDLIDKKKDVKGFQAVKNIETILNDDFATLGKLADGKRETQLDSYHKEITADFNEKWKQRIGVGDGAKIHIKYNQGGAPGAAYLSFFIVSKEREWLTPNQRSLGFKWFLSFYLHLKAESKKNKSSLVILFDEPGLYLHSRAQKDMMSVIEELSLKDQIIYSTHSPYLIDANKLHRIKLVLNSENCGTTVEKITTNKIENQKDALKPIIDAMGLDIAHNFSPIIKNNVIVEGISDFYYLTAFKSLLGIRDQFAIVPSMGASNAHLLMELCIGWGLNWLIIFDDKGARKEFTKIQKNFFNDNLDEITTKIYIIKGCDGIEDIFKESDLKLVRIDASFPSTIKNSEKIKDYGGKELYARLFLDKVNSNEIRIEHIDSATIDRFKKIFKFIEDNF